MIISILESVRRRHRHTAGARSRRRSMLLQAITRGRRRPKADRQHATALAIHRAMAPVARVDDFEGSMVLVVAHHALDETTIAYLQVSVADLVAGRFLHLDLSETSIDTPQAMRCLERFLDHLEDRGVGLRVVGLDPAHPLLAVPAA